MSARHTSQHGSPAPGNVTPYSPNSFNPPSQPPLSYRQTASHFGDTPAAQHRATGRSFTCIQTGKDGCTCCAYQGRSDVQTTTPPPLLVTPYSMPSRRTSIRTPRGVGAPVTPRPHSTTSNTTTNLPQTVVGTRRATPQVPEMPGPSTPEMPAGHMTRRSSINAPIPVRRTASSFSQATGNQPGPAYPLEMFDMSAAAELPANKARPQSFRRSPSNKSLRGSPSNRSLRGRGSSTSLRNQNIDAQHF